MMIKKSFFLLLFFVSFNQIKVQAQLFPNSDFENGGIGLCNCPTGYYCKNDAGRVVDGVNPLYSPSSYGCIGSVNYTNPLGALSGKGYVYFYAGADELITPTVKFNEGDKINLCVWYAGPQVQGGPGQNSLFAYFSFGVDGNKVGPEIPVPTGTKWTKHCYNITMTAGNHNFSILSGGSAQYSMWFDSFAINVCKLPTVNFGKDTSFYKGDSILIDAFSLESTYLWSDNSTNSTLTVSKPGVYWFQVTNKCGTYIDSINVTFKEFDIEIVMPNIFTPNADGINDYFRPLKMWGIRNSIMKIYNRWGQVVYESSDLTQGWNGKTKDKQCSDGTYFWVVSFQDIHGQHSDIHGTLTLVK